MPMFDWFDTKISFTKKVTIGKCIHCHHPHTLRVKFEGRRGKKVKPQIVILRCPDTLRDFEWILHSKNRIESILSIDEKGLGTTTAAAGGGGAGGF